VPDAARLERIKLFAGMLDRVGTVCFAVGVVTPISASIIGMPQMPVIDIAQLAASLAVWTAVFVILHARATMSWRGCAMTGFEFFAFFGVPLLVGTFGVLAAYLFRRHMRRADMGR